MSRLKAVFRCQDCGFASPKWAGQCAECGAWNTMTEEAVEVRSAAPAGASKSAPRPLTDFKSAPTKLAEVVGAEEKRIPTSLPELDRLLGGGFVAGQVVLLAGPPGIGKSTLMLQAAEKLSRKDKVLYISGEESPSQVAGRAKRLGVASQNIIFLAETDLSKILDAVAEQEPGVIVLDSIQTVYHPEMAGSPGSVGQVRECAAELLRAAKSRDAILLILGHVTKEGSVAGPKVLEHIVDTVLQFDTEGHELLRLLRAQKNRFGPSTELGFFQMTEKGLEGVADASSFFVEEVGSKAVPGRAVSVAMEGSRPLLVEVQALVTPTRYPLPRRMATGLDLNRTLVLIAALEKHLRLRLENSDIFVSLAGGLRLRDPGLDLAVCMALVSSARDAALPTDRVFVGEVGLLGNLGRVAFLSPRLKEAERAGFRSALVPAKSLADVSKGAASRPAGPPYTTPSGKASGAGAAKPGLQLLGAEDIASAVAKCLKDEGESF